jgi:hypothetical protein
MDLFHPVFDRAKKLIEAKLNRYGLNADGRLIVTLRDLSLDSEGDDTASTGCR